MKKALFLLGLTIFGLFVFQSVQAATQTIRPDGPGSETALDWHYYCVTAFGKAHWECVAEVSPDLMYVGGNQTSYIRDLYSVSDPSQQQGTINKVTIYINPGFYNLGAFKSSLRTYNRTYDGAEVINPASTFGQEWILNPWTNSAWTWSEIVNLEIGVSIRWINMTPGVTQVYAVVDYNGSGISPTVITQPATNIQSILVTGNGNITNIGSENADLRGFRWGTASGVYTNTSTDSGSFGTGAFTKSITNLNPSTTYYYQAIAHNTFGWSYGAEQRFTTAQVTILRPNGQGSETSIDFAYKDWLHLSPDEHWKSVDDVIPDTSGYLSAYPDGYKRDLFTIPDIASGSIISKVTIYFRDLGTQAYYKPSLRTNGQTWDGTAVRWDVQEWHTHSQELILNPITNQSWTEDEINALEIGVSLQCCNGNYSTAVTQVYAEIEYRVIPTIATQLATNITSNSATLNGTITNIGSENADLRGFRWGTAPGVYTNTSTDSGSFGTGDFNKNISLQPNTIYYYQAIVHNSMGWVFGQELSFTTFNWLSGYNHRKQITVNGSAVGAQTNYQLKLTVNRGPNTDSGSNVYLNNNSLNWPNDIRFTKSDGITTLDYWLESVDDGAIVGPTDLNIYSAASPGYAFWDKWTASGSGTVSKIRVYGYLNGGNVKVALYSDNGGSPGTVLAKQDTSTAIMPNQWNTITLLNAAQVVSGTNYWIAVLSDTQNVAYRSLASGGVDKYKSVTYSSWSWADNPSGLTDSSTWYLYSQAVTSAYSANVWVEFDSLPSSSANFYIYYGNASASSASNGDNTFIFFDDFTGTTINTAKWSKTDVGSNISQNGSLIMANGTAVWGQTTMYSNTNFNRSDNILIQGKYKSTSARGTTYKDTTMLWTKDSTAGVNYTDMIYGFYFYESAGVNYLYMYEDGTGRANITPAWVSGTQYWVRQIIKAGGGATTQISTDGNTWTTKYDSFYSAETPVKVGFTHYQGGDVIIDDVLVRKYVSPEPSFSSWGVEQGKSGVTTQNATNITSNSVEGNGNITTTGGANADIRGFRWGTVPGVYTNTSTDSGNFGTGAFSKSITNLDQGTTYYYQAIAHNAFGWNYGAEQRFVTAQVTILRPNGQGSETSLYGWFDGQQGPNWDAVNDISPDENITMVHNFYTTKDQYHRDLYALSDIPSGSTISKVTIYFRGLGAADPYQNYYKPSLRTNSQTWDGAEIRWLANEWHNFSSQELINNPITNQPWTGDEINALEAGINMKSSTDFSGQITQVYIQVEYIQNVPTVTTQPATDIFASSATGNGVIVSSGGANADLRGFRWGTVSGVYTNTSTDSGSFTAGDFNKNIGLQSGTTYYYQAMARNLVGWGYGLERSFTTPEFCAAGHQNNGDGTCTAIFYPDAHPESTTFDGYVVRAAVNNTWSQLRDGVGTGSGDAGNIIYAAEIDSGTSAWNQIIRGITLFNTQSIPDNATLLSATYSIYGAGKSNGFSWTPAVNVYSSSPSANTNVSNSDYITLGSVKLSDTDITYNAWSIAGYNNFTLNSTGLLALSKTGVTKLGIRESTYDWPNNAPPWQASKTMTMYGYSVDQAGTSSDPKLVVTYASSPVVATQLATDIRGTTATGNGNITSVGIDSATLRGVRWGTTSGVYDKTALDSGTFNTGSFTKAMTGLSPATTYYYQAIAYNSAGWGSGSERSFTTTYDLTLTLRPNATGTQTQLYSPSCTVNWDCVDEAIADNWTTYIEPLSVGTSSDLFALPDSNLSGEINSVTVYAKMYGLYTNAPVSGGTYIKTNGQTFFSNKNPSASWAMYSTQYINNPQTGNRWTWAEINALQIGAQLEYQSDAMSLATQIYTVVNYTPPPAVPTITTGQTTSTLASSVMGNGNIADVGWSAVTQRGVRWGVVSGIYTNTSTDSGNFGTGAFTKSITSLSPNTIYHYQAIARNSAGWGYGEDQSFTTSLNDASPDGCVTWSWGTPICTGGKVTASLSWPVLTQQDVNAVRSDCTLSSVSYTVEIIGLGSVNVGGSTSYNWPNLNPNTTYTLQLTNSYQCTDQYDYGTILMTPYSIITPGCNNPPAKPVVSEVDWNRCAFQGSAVPTLSWSFSDPDLDPQAAYEVEIDDNASFNAPKFNNLVNLQSNSYVLDLHDDDEEPDNLPTSMQDYQLDWNATYFWRVRVKDNHNNWSEWSNPNQSKTDKHASPWVDFSWAPTEPTQNETAEFTDQTQPFGGTTIISRLWTIISGSGSFVDGTNNAATSPHLQFSTLSNTLRLEITDSDNYTCYVDKDVNVELPLPEYKEVSPYILFKEIIEAMFAFLD